MRTIFIASLFLVACSSVQPEPVCEPRNGEITEQGRENNGREANGREGNGRESNGREPNGRDGNGREMNGVSMRLTRPGGTTGAVSLEGSQLVAADAADVVGAALEAVDRQGKVHELRIAGVERDPSDPALAYYDVELDGRPLCMNGQKGLFVPGVWDERGAWQPSKSVGGRVLRASYSCSDGVIAKCVRWGYKPWIVGSDVHQTCTRMARADYCGDGASHTKEGTEVDLYDARGVQSPTADPGFVFEAGWGPSGATCVSRPRFDTLDTRGRPILPSCWTSLPRCESWADARAAGAELGVSSRPARRALCD